MADTRASTHEAEAVALELPEPAADEKALRFLVDAGEVLSSSLDYDQTLRHLADLAVPYLADWCVIDVLGSDGVLRRVATVHPDPAKRELVQKLDEKYPPRADSAAGPYSVIRTGVPECVAAIPDSLLQATSQDEEHYRIVRELGLHSYICVPLAARGRSLGAITLIQAESGREYDSDDQFLAEELARRAAVAVDNARLYRAAQEEIQERERVENLLAAQKHLLARIATGAQLPDILHAVTAMVESRDPGVLCSILLMDPDGKRLRNGAAPSLPAAYNAVIDGIEIGPCVGSCGTAAYHKKRTIVSDIAQDPLWAAFKDLALGHGLAACWSSPAIAEDGEVLGTVAIYCREPRTPDRFQLELLETATYLVGIAIERKRTESALDESRQWFAMTLKSIGDAVIATDASGRISFMNTVAEQLTGWKVDEAQGKPCRDVFRIINHYTREEVDSPVDKVMLEGGIVGLANHTLLVARDGSELPIDDSGAPIRDEAGNLVGIVLVFRDISERASVLKALRESEERYRTIVETANEGLWLVNQQGNTLYVNKRMAGMLGRESADLQGHALHEYCVESDRSAAQSHIRSNLQGRAEQFDFRFVHKDGHVVPVLACTSAVRNGEGEVIGALGLFTDITARLEAEARRRRAQAEAETRARQQRALADLGVKAFSYSSMTEWMQIVTETIARTLDLEFCKVLELLPTGEVFLKAGIGWREGLVGHAVVPTGKDSQAGYTLLVREPVIVEDLRTDARFNGPALLLEHGVVSGISVIVSQDQGKPWGVMGAHSRHKRVFTADDVAFFQGVANLMGLVLERNRQKEEIDRTTREITALNKRLHRSIAETHHRVKNNLQVISALVEIQSMRGDEVVSAAEIQRLGHHVRGLAAIHDLLTLEVRADGTVEKVSARDALDRLIPLLQTIIGSRKIESRVDDIALPIRQCTGLALLVNELVSNATKHGKGEIIINFTADSEREAWACLEVCDDGVGFPPDFDPVKNAHTGLELIESVGRWDLRGEVMYENREEGGACVKIRFPAFLGTPDSDRLPD